MRNTYFCGGNLIRDWDGILVKFMRNGNLVEREHVYGVPCRKHYKKSAKLINSFLASFVKDPLLSKIDTINPRGK